MGKLSLIRTFVQVVRTNGFARASRVLNVTPSVVSKRVAELEQELRVKLLVRTTRRLQLTDFGTRYFVRASELLNRFDELERDALRHRDEAAGLIRIASPTSIGIKYIGGMLESFRTSRPNVHFDLILLDSAVDPVEDDFDLVLAEQPYVLRSGELTEEPLCAIPRTVCASPGYLARMGAPATPRDLIKHDVLNYSFLPSGNVWVFEGSGGGNSVEISPTFSTSNGLIMRSIALRDGGIMMAPTHVVLDDLKSGALVPVLEDYRLPQFWLVAVLPPLSRLSKRVRWLVTHLRTSFSPPPWASTPQRSPKKPARRS